MLRTESYIYGNHEFIEAGEIYYFGQLWGRRRTSRKRSNCGL